MCLELGRAAAYPWSMMLHCFVAPHANTGQDSDIVAAIVAAIVVVIDAAILAATVVPIVVTIVVAV